MIHGAGQGEKCKYLEVWYLHGHHSEKLQELLFRNLTLETHILVASVAHTIWASCLLTSYLLVPAQQSKE